MIGAILTGNNVVNIAASALTTGLLLSWFGDVGVLYATAIMTVVVVVFTEVLPKTLAINAPDRVALLVGAPDLLDGAAVRTDADRASRRWCASILRLFGFRVGTDQAFLSAHEELRGAGRSPASRRAASRSRTATCSAACSTCAISSSPT